MKIKIRKGKAIAKIEKRDLRIGNYVVTDEGNFIKVTDISGSVSHRFAAMNLVKGVMFKQLFKEAKEGDEGALKLLESYCVVMHNVLSCFPFSKSEFNYLEAINEATIRCYNDNKELYGIKDEPTDEENEKALESVKENEEVREKMEDFGDE